VLIKKSQPHNPYMKPSNVSTTDKDNVSMHESSPSSKGSGSEEVKDNDNVATTAKEDPNHMEEEEVNFKETPFLIPPSFNCPINKETL